MSTSAAVYVESTALPVVCCGPNQSRLVNRLEMIRFYASEWNQIVRDIEALAKSTKHVSDEVGAGASVAEAMSGEKDNLLLCLQRIVNSCDKLRLKFSSTYAGEIVQYVERRSGWGLGAPDRVTGLPTIPSRLFNPLEFWEEVTTLRKRMG